jgi:CDP-diacylglycerol--serine O-phosphatidyltransferase
MFNLPNLLTLSNLFFGCCALLYTLYGQPEQAAWCTLGCFLCDYADGMTARALKISSPLGKELDSLADVVSFGVVPGAMLYQLLSGPMSVVPGWQTTLVNPTALPAFVLTAFSALRLAKFNLDTRQTNYFLGLSTPACTVFVLGLTLANHQNAFGVADLLARSPWALYLLIAVLSALLVSEIPMFGMKIKSLDWRSNLPLLLALVVVGALFVLLGSLALSAGIVFYIVCSVIYKNRITA